MKLTITYTLKELKGLISPLARVVGCTEEDVLEIEELAAQVVCELSINGHVIEADDLISVSVSESGMINKFLGILVRDAEKAREVMEAVRESVEKKEPAGSGEDSHEKPR